MPASNGSSLSPDTFRRLEPLTNDYRFLPVGNGRDGKAPLISAWQNFPGASVQQLSRWPGIKSIGVITGPSLLCFDFDGLSAIEKAIDVYGLDPDEVRTWRIDRDNDPDRLKLIFRPSAEQLAQLPDRSITTKEKTKDKVVDADGKVIAKAEAIEVFLHPGRQVIVAGDHPSSGGVYLWPEGLGPERLVPPPPLWWSYVIEKSRDFPKPAAGANRVVRTTRSYSNSDWQRLQHCPVCGRGPHDNPLCQLHRDGETLRCYLGTTFSPPKGLAPGQLAPGTEWAYSSQSSSGWGEFLVFVKDRPSPLRQIHSWMEQMQ